MDWSLQLAAPSEIPEMLLRMDVLFCVSGFQDFPSFILAVISLALPFGVKALNELMDVCILRDKFFSI